MRGRISLPLCLLAIAAAPVSIERGRDPLAGPEFLPVDEAFVFTAQLHDDRLVARWAMPEGYYLYRRAFRVQAGDGVTLGELAVPEGKRIVDEYFGESEVYYRHVEVAAPVLSRTGDSVRASVHYQGCADAGLCYPPQERSVALRVDAEGEDQAPGADQPRADVP